MKILRLLGVVLLGCGLALLLQLPDAAGELSADAAASSFSGRTGSSLRAVS